MENPKQEVPCGRLKAEIRPLVSLPTAKPLRWFFNSPRGGGGGCALAGSKVSRTAPKDFLTPAERGGLSCGFLLRSLGLSLALGKGSFGKSQFRGVEPCWVLCVHEGVGRKRDSVRWWFAEILLWS